jgi:two-component system sensor histidine kinase TctE
MSSIDRTEMSISRQLLTWLLVPVCVLFTASSIVAYNLAAWCANEANDQELLSSAHNVAARLYEDKNGVVAELPKAVQAVLRHDDRDSFYYQVLDEHNQRLTGDGYLPMPTSDTQTDVPRFRDAEVNRQPVRMARIRTALQGHPDRIVIVQVAQTLHARRGLIEKIFLSIVIPQMVLCGLSGLAVWLGVRHGLRPLRKLSEDIGRRSQFDLTPISTNQSPIEVRPIVEALNSLLGRLESHIDAQQRFVANAAHQLRTPVAGLKAYIEYGRRSKNGKIAEVFDQLDRGADRMSELIAGLLVLARATDRPTMKHEPVELNQLVSEITSCFAREAAVKDLELTFIGSEQSAIVEGDHAQLREMISNLVDNSIRFSPPNGKVIVKVDRSLPLTVSVSDTGPGIPPEERKRVFERFYRLLGTKVNGTGLGLAIVNEIALAHNANVELLDGPDGQGTLARISFNGQPQ